MVERPEGGPLPEDVLADDSEQGADGIAGLPQRLARYGLAHQRAVHMAQYAQEQGELQLAGQLGRCGHWLVFRDYYTVGKVRLHAADFCRKHLLCPLCAIRRASKHLKAYMDRLDLVMAQNPGLRAYFVTLTVKDGPDLAERFRHLRQAMRSMSQARRDHLKAPSKNRRVEFVKALGGVHSIEAKRGANSGLWHPHAHMVWLCRESPDQERLAAEWQAWTGDSFVVDVRPFHDPADVVAGFLELFKYALKFNALPLVDNWHAFQVLTGKRLIDSFGLLRGVDVPDDLTDEPLLDDLPYLEMVYQWLGGRAGYSLERCHVSAEESGRVLTPCLASVPLS